MVAVTHLRKGEGKAVYRAMGSLAFVAAARSVLAVAPHPKDMAEADPKRRRKLVLPVKGNLGPPAPGLGYIVNAVSVGDLGPQPIIRWLDVRVATTAEEAFGDMSGGGDKAAERHEAEEWLRAFLADGPKPGKEVKLEASEAGFSEPTIRRA